MIFQNVHEIVLDRVFMRLHGFIRGIDVFLKLEGVHPAGSIKIKTAAALVGDAEESGLLRPGSRIIESTSGNMGIALAMICAAKNYSVTLVTDPNANRQSIRIIEELGADVVKVTEGDPDRGFLQARIDYILKRLAAEPDLVWLNQYANAENVRVHYERTARAIHEEFGDLDALFVGAGTTGTLMGCVRYFREHNSRTKIIAVDSVGSVTFGGPARTRYIPGLGTSRMPEIFVDDGSFEKVVVEESEAIAMCHRIARQYGLLIGGSTGTILRAIEKIPDGTLPPGSRVVAISPDLGERYLDTVYSTSWVAMHYDGGG